jgi:hypothetical protein
VQKLEEAVLDSVRCHRLLHIHHAADSHNQLHCLNRYCTFDQLLFLSMEVVPAPTWPAASFAVEIRLTV